MMQADFPGNFTKKFFFTFGSDFDILSVLVIQPDRMQIWFIGRTLASQAEETGSTPAICFTGMEKWLETLAHQGIELFFVIWKTAFSISQTLRGGALSN